jgi:hypothetical protein
MPALRQRFTRLTATSRFVRHLPALALVAGALLVPSTALAANHVKVNLTAPSHNIVPGKALRVTVKSTFGGHATTGKAYYLFHIAGLPGQFGPKANQTTQKLKNGKTVFSIGLPKGKTGTEELDEALNGQKSGLKFSLRITVKTPHGTTTATFPVKFIK